jgi:hypothetical protein
MPRIALALSLLALFPSHNSLADIFSKCKGPDSHKLTMTPTIIEKTLPPGVEIVDDVWLKNPTSTAFITFTPEKGAEARTNYRQSLGEVPTTKDELPGLKLVNGERYEYHFPENPQYTGDQGKPAVHGGWVHQDYTAGLIEPATPKLPEPLIEKIYSGKVKEFAVKNVVPYYFGGKKSKIDFIFYYKRNPRYGMVAPGCPEPSATPSPIPSP